MTTLSPEHYSRCKIEPWDFIKANNLDFFRGNIIKYIMRYDAKNGNEDLLKARTYLDKLLGEKSRKISDLDYGDKLVIEKLLWNPDGETGDERFVLVPEGLRVKVCAARLPTKLSDAFISEYNKALKDGVEYLLFAKERPKPRCQEG